MSNADDIAAALEPVAIVFRELGVRFFVGGSVASSYHGAARSTVDVDVVADLRMDDVNKLVAASSEDYYVSEVAIRDAISTKSCFNLIHYETSFKIDVFVFKDREFDRAAMSRAIQGEFGNRRTITVPVSSPEDIIISKLEWYRMGNESSERQWQDVTKVLQLLGESADFAYLQASAASVGVSDLLEKLFAE